MSKTKVPLRRVLNTERVVRVLYRAHYNSAGEKPSDAEFMRVIKYLFEVLEDTDKVF